MQLHRSAFSALFALSFFFAGCGEEEPDPSKEADLDETSEGEETEEGLGGEETEEETDKEATECAAGSWDDDSDPTTACVTRTACVAGEYVKVEGDAKTDRSCAACEEGSFSPEENAATCTVFSTCANGVLAEGSEVADVVCKPEIEQLVTAGDRHSCALLDTGAVHCWGSNFYGQLGDGSENDSTTPVAVYWP
ncbi:MAG: hypothetical protein MK135_11765 [Polyangiaceae bacterium]|nr:hypothetical protein [Polyangiaceae bacterium]